MAQVHFILFVSDQLQSKQFYTQVLAIEPFLDEPGMTEFSLPGGSVLGLMPTAGIKRLLGDLLPDPDIAQGIPRAELYLVVNGAERFHQRALEAGATELSSFQARGWGDRVAYSLDLDGHVLAFAEEIMELKIFEVGKQKIAEVLADEVVISSAQDALDLMATANYEGQGVQGIILYEKNLQLEFFALRSGLAGDVLQKLVNYRMKLAVIGDFEKYTSKSLRAFIVESNRGKSAFFVADRETAVAKIAN